MAGLDPATQTTMRRHDTGDDAVSVSTLLESG
jgi:hypothetical protein